MNREQAEAELRSFVGMVDAARRAAADPKLPAALKFSATAALGAISAQLGDTLRVFLDATPPDQASYTCPICQGLSYNRSDIENHYCGRCHVFENDAKAAAVVTKPGDRLVSAFVALREAFELAGMATPLAVVLPAGEAAKLATILRYHPRLMIEDRLSGSEPSVWGIRVLEGEPDANSGFDDA